MFTNLLTGLKNILNRALEVSPNSNLASGGDEYSIRIWNPAVRWCLVIKSSPECQFSC